MSKMSLLAAELSELKRCGETLISVAETLTELFSEGKEETEVQPTPESQPEKTYSFTEVRSILATCSRNGHTAAVKDLLHKYGVDKLSDLAEEHYAAIVADAEAL